jgi:hypothetical protein
VRFFVFYSGAFTFVIICICWLRSVFYSFLASASRGCVFIACHASLFLIICLTFECASFGCFIVIWFAGLESECCAAGGIVYYFKELEEGNGVLRERVGKGSEVGGGVLKGVLVGIEWKNLRFQIVYPTLLYSLLLSGIQMR